MRKSLTWLNLVILLMTTLTGCSSNDNSDLQKFIDETRDRKNPQVDEPPKYEMAPSFIYGADNQRDPFMPFDDGFVGPETGTEPGKGGNVEVPTCPQRPQTDRNRVRVGLELLPLDSLRMVGSLKDQDNVLLALVIAPDGTVYRVKQGDYMGLNYGQIVSVTEAKIELAELYPDGKGCFGEQITPVLLFENK